MSSVGIVDAGVARAVTGFAVRVDLDARFRVSPEDAARTGWDTGQMARRVCSSVLVVDDHGGFRTWARACLAAEGYVVVGEAAGGVDAIAAVRRLRPDLVLLDVHLPDLDGFEVARRLAEEPEAPVVVLVSSRDMAEFGRRSVAIGVRGFVSKAELSGGTLHAVVSRRV